MGITGTEAALAADLETEITNAIIAEGNEAPDASGITGLANGIANAIIPHITSNAKALVPTGAIDTGGGPGPSIPVELAII